MNHLFDFENFKEFSQILATNSANLHIIQEEKSSYCFPFSESIREFRQNYISIEHTISKHCWKQFFKSLFQWMMSLLCSMLMKFCRNFANAFRKWKTKLILNFTEFSTKFRELFNIIIPRNLKFPKPNKLLNIIIHYPRHFFNSFLSFTPAPTGVHDVSVPGGGRRVVGPWQSPARVVEPKKWSE